MRTTSTCARCGGERAALERGAVAGTDAAIPEVTNVASNARLVATRTPLSRDQIQERVKAFLTPRPPDIVDPPTPATFSISGRQRDEGVPPPIDLNARIKAARMARSGGVL
jgi:hypothetical protein